jgi:hypothetical protein
MFDEYMYSPKPIFEYIKCTLSIDWFAGLPNSLHTTKHFEYSGPS